MSRKTSPASVLLCALLWSVTAAAQTPAAPQKVSIATAKQSSLPLPELGGVVTSQALTQYGQWFHAGFTQAWGAHADIDGYQLLVKERLLPRGGSEVQIFSGENMVYRAMLPRNPVQIAALSEAAVELAYQNAAEQGLQALLFRDADMALSGL